MTFFRELPWYSWFTFPDVPDIPCIKRNDEEYLYFRGQSPNVDDITLPTHTTIVRVEASIEAPSEVPEGLDMTFGELPMYSWFLWIGPHTQNDLCLKLDSNAYLWYSHGGANTGGASPTSGPVRKVVVNFAR